MKKFTRTLAPGAEASIEHAGRYIRGVSGPEPYKVRLDDRPLEDLETGIGQESVIRFNTVRIVNTAKVEQTITVGIADAYIADNRLVGNMDVTGGIGIRGGKAFKVSAPEAQATAALLLAADLDNRKSVLINPVSAILIGDSLDNESEWFPLTGAITIDGGSAVYAKGAAGAAVKTHLLEEFS